MKIYIISHFLVALLLPFLLCIIDLERIQSGPLRCRDPSLNETLQTKDRKFLLLDSYKSALGGIGNLLIFFPAAFYYAVFTGRDIMIMDHSPLGEMCRIVQCGFPFVSEVREAYPSIINDKSLRYVPGLKGIHFIRYTSTSKDIDSPIAAAVGFQSKSDWWVQFNTSVQCVSNITGCKLGDVMCAEQYAFQRLIQGPFNNTVMAKHAKRIQEMSEKMKQALMQLPHAHVPRIDIAIHLRLQFYHFEHQQIRSERLQNEVQEWLLSAERRQIYATLGQRVQKEVQRLRSNISIPVSNPVSIHLATDNQQVKDHFHHYLLSLLYAAPITIMKIDSSSIHHVKNWTQFQQITNHEGMFDLALDWYALSLANTIYAWRKSSTTMVSTFVHSARKVSGSKEGAVTKGYQLVRTKRGSLRFVSF